MCINVCREGSRRIRACCSVLQCVAVFVAVCCNVLQCVAVCCSALQCVAVCCSVLQNCVVCCRVCCRMLQYIHISNRYLRGRTSIHIDTYTYLSIHIHTITCTNVYICTCINMYTCVCERQQRKNSWGTSEYMYTHDTSEYMYMVHLNTCTGLFCKRALQKRLHSAARLDGETLLCGRKTPRHFKFQDIQGTSEYMYTHECIMHRSVNI